MLQSSCVISARLRDVLLIYLVLNSEDFREFLPDFFQLLVYWLASNYQYR